MFGINWNNMHNRQITRLRDKEESGSPFQMSSVKRLLILFFNRFYFVVLQQVAACPLPEKSRGKAIVIKYFVVYR
jgi:hypothetical protein